MNVREKLVELLQNAKAAMKSENLSCDIARNMFVVDFMMSNGVTVQEWIPVEDKRKPKEGEDVLVAVFDGYDTYTDMDCLMRDGKWCFETENYKVTHWMEKPKPPKGE